MPALRVLQLTDTHLFAAEDATLLGVDTGAALRLVCHQAAEQYGSPDLVLATGDLAHEGEPGAYERFLAMMDEYFEAPVAWVPGNHDSGPIMEELAATVRHDFRDEAWEFVLLDSHIEGEVPGRLGAEELDRLANVLETSTREHVAIALHHHLLPIDADWLDEQRVSNADALLDVVVGDGRIRLIVCGHVHQEFDAEWRGIRLLASPATCFQFMPRSVGFTLDVRAPGCRWLELYEDGTFFTEVSRVEEFELPEAPR